MIKIAEADAALVTEALEAAQLLMTDDMVNSLTGIGTLTLGKAIRHGTALNAIISWSMIGCIGEEAPFLTWIVPGGELPNHVDVRGGSTSRTVTLQVSETTRFNNGSEGIVFRAGELWEWSPKLFHSMKNDSETTRVAIVMPSVVPLRRAA